MVAGGSRSVALTVDLVRVPRWIAGALRSLPDDGCRAWPWSLGSGLPDGLQGLCGVIVGVAVVRSPSMAPGVDWWRGFAAWIAWPWCGRFAVMELERWRLGSLYGSYTRPRTPVRQKGLLKPASL